jgi:hypothetical protein
MPHQTNAKYQQPEPRNREERRRAEFGPTGSETGAIPTDDPRGRSSHATTANQGDLAATGAGSGGATETDRRLPEHEGRHQPSRPNG